VQREVEDAQPAVPHAGATVFGTDGVCATIDEPAVAEGKIRLIFEDGSRVLLDVAAASLRRAEDGSYSAGLPLGALLDRVTDEVSEVTLPLREESVQVGTRETETGRVRISTQVEQHERWVDVSGWADEVAVERVSVNRVVDRADPPKVREEGDTLVIPVLEETLVVEKRLVLHEELRLTRIRRNISRRQRVPLRRERVFVERLPAQLHAQPPAGQTHQLRGGSQASASQSDRSSMMATTTVIAVFDNYEDAQAAKADLADIVPDSDVKITANQSVGGPTEHVIRHGTEQGDGQSFGERIAHFFRSLFGPDDEHHAGHYSEAVRRGSCVVTVELQDSTQADAVTDILRSHDAIDIEDRAEQWRGRGWSGYDPNAAPLSEDELAQERQYGTRPAVEAGSDAAATIGTAGPTDIATATSDATAATGQETKLPVIEEELKVGKRQRTGGGVRVYTRTTERPVEEQVNLREERATVERRPVDRPASEADMAGFTEKSVEVVETAEEAVVSKTARVVEEVVVGKETRERAETVSDVVRRTDVEVEQLGSDAQADQGAARSRTRLDGDKARSNSGRNE